MDVEIGVEVANQMIGAQLATAHGRVGQHGRDEDQSLFRHLSRNIVSLNDSPFLRLPRISCTRLMGGTMSQ